MTTNRTPVVRLMRFLWIWIFAPSPGFGVEIPVAKEEFTRPNILLILADDLRWDAVAAIGVHPWLKTPHIDRLAAEGVMFTRAFCNSPLCNASRTSIMSGRYPHRTGVYGFENVPDDSPHLRPWLPELLEVGGYQRAHFGKNGSARRVRDPATGKWGPDSPKYFPDGHTELGDYKKLEPSEKTLDEAVLGVIRRSSKGGVIIGGTHPAPAGQTIDAFIAKDAIGFVESRPGDSSAPFFLNVGFQFPHTPVLVPKPFDEMYSPGEMPFAELSDIEREAISEQVKTAIRLFGMHGLTKEQILRTVAHYYAYTTYGDHHVGKLIEAFKAKSEEQNRPWLIVFGSDNGWHLGEHGMNAKFTFYDVSVRVPLIIASSADRFPRGKVHGGLVEYVDIAPTILGAAGITSPDHLDGVDLHGLLTGTIKPRREVISEEFHVLRRAMIRGFSGDRELVLSLRTKPDCFRIPEDFDWLRTQPAEALDVHLFDVGKDPRELENLAADPAHAPVVADLKARLIKRLYDGRIEPRWQDLLPQQHRYGDSKADSEGD